MRPEKVSIDSKLLEGKTEAQPGEIVGLDACTARTSSQ